MPEGWHRVRLESLAQGHDGLFADGDWIESKDQDPTGTIRLVQVGNVRPGSLRLEGQGRWVNAATVERLRCTLLREGDVLIARMPDPIGRATLIPRLPYPAITAVDCAVLRTNAEKALPEYVVQVLNSAHNLRMVGGLVSGTTRQRVSRTNLGNMEIAVPPVPEQRRIAAILSSADDAIEAIQAVIDQLQVVKKALLAELLTRGLPGRHRRFRATESGEMPEEWELRTIGDCAEVVGGFAFPHAAQGRTGGKYPFFKVSDMTADGNDELMTSAANYVSEEDLKKLKAKVYPTGTIVFAKVGGALLTNKRRLLGTPALFDNNIMGLIPKAVDPRFLFFFMTSLDFASIVQPGALPSINGTMVKRILLMVPSPDEQRGIVEVLGAVTGVVEAEVSALSRQQEAKAALAHVLLSGVLRVPSAGSAEAA